MSLNLQRLNLEGLQVEFLTSKEGNSLISTCEGQDICEVVQAILSEEDDERCFGVIFFEEKAIGIVKGYDEPLITPKVNAMGTLREIVEKLELEKILILEKEDNNSYRFISE